jgi:chromosome segregation ATPase
MCSNCYDTLEHLPAEVNRTFNGINIYCAGEYSKNLQKMIRGIKDLNAKKSNMEALLKESEVKKVKLQRENYDLNNVKKVNDTKIKKLNKKIDELTIEEENYEIQTHKKDKAMEQIKQFVDMINSIQPV